MRRNIKKHYITQQNKQKAQVQTNRYSYAYLPLNHIKTLQKKTNWKSLRQEPGQHF